LLGATPKKQQIMQVLGVVAAAFTVGPVLSLLNTAYGFGPKTIEHPNALAAPQANLMSSVAQGVFGGKLPWDMMFVGMGVAVLIILIDLYLEYKKIDFRMPVLAVAAGLYLPFELDSTIFIGGLLAWVITRYQDKNKKAKVKTHEAAKVVGERAGLLFASGLITGEALIGISIAIPVAITGRPDVLALIPQRWGSWPGVAAVAVVMAGIYIVSQRAFKRYSD
jgi:putative OPT family oligopeptide transporter